MLNSISTTIKPTESINEIHPQEEHWTEVIKPKTGLFDLRLKVEEFTSLQVVVVSEKEEVCNAINSPFTIHHFR